MIIPFVFTLDTMGNGRPLTWVFNKAVSFCQKQKWPVIAQKQYFESYNEDWNSSSESAEYFEYDVPQPIYLERIESVVIPQKIESDFIKKFPSQVDAYMASVRCEWQEMTTFLIDEIHRLEKLYGEKVEAVTSMLNYHFLNEACEKCGIPVLYYEWGPFRAPNYRNTAYLDFKGLQGNCSIEENYKLFKKEMEDGTCPILSSKQILGIFLKNDKLEYLWKDDSIPVYQIGIAAGYTIPCVTTAYNAVTLDEMVYQSRKVFRMDEIGIRLHPGDPMKAHPLYGNIDGCELIDFILKSKRIMSSSSNMAYEAALYNRPTYDLGWSPFSFAVNTSLEGLKDKIPDMEVLSFIAFGALVPFELLNTKTSHT